MTALSAAQALQLRMHSLLLADSPSRSVADIVEWFGAMQAQDVGSALWSFGVRMRDVTRTDIEKAVERREALRTWPMRGTVHFVPPKDAGWMLELMAPRALAGAKKRREYLGISDEQAEHAVEVLGSALTGNRLRRSECIALLAEHDLMVHSQSAYHLLWYASQRGVTCIGPDLDGEQTFVRLDEWVTRPNVLDREAALATMALRYFRSHGPASRHDFARWTDLTMADVKAGIALVGAELQTVDVDGTEMLVVAGALDTAPPLRDSLLVLPGFDEYMLGYKDRSLFMEPTDLDYIVPGSNGIFRGTVVASGRVIATWKQAGSAKKPAVEVTGLPGRKPPTRSRLKAAFVPYSTYRAIEVEVRQ